MKTTINLCIIAIFTFITLSCSQTTNRRADAEKIITEWVGKAIQFSDDIPLSVYGKDTLLGGFHSTPYKVLLYVDSMGCTSCKLKLYEWQRLIAEADTILADKLSFIFIFQPKNSDELVYIFKRDRFNYPVYIDKNNEINQLNHFPEKPEYQCFLLNEQNIVLSVGNPAHNAQIWCLYKQIITGKFHTENRTNTQVNVLNNVVQLNGVQPKIKYECIFRLKNSGSKPLVIANIKSSCGCTNVKWEKKPIESDSITEIKATIEIENSGYFEKTLSVFCNAENSPLTLKIKGNTKQ